MIRLALALLLAGCTYVKTTARDGTVTEAISPGLIVVGPSHEPGDVQEIAGFGGMVSAGPAGAKAVIGAYRLKTVFADDCMLALETDRPDLILPDLTKPCEER